MFEVTGEDIAALDDGVLREIVARLCEAELIQTGLSSSAVSWGGGQDAPDGGLDIRIETRTCVNMNGFVPRANTGIQVKKPDMPRGAILSEMRPDGILRTAIADLASIGGAYIIACSSGSTSDSALAARRTAMREALIDTPNADALYIDFYDRRRLASWVNAHPGIVALVNERLGRKSIGWQPYGAWSHSASDISEAYIPDEKGRMSFDQDKSGEPIDIVSGLNRLRKMLSPDRAVIRLVGLSGVGKTRFIQALFDDRIGEACLPPTDVIYSDLADSPVPQPMELLAELVQKKQSAVLIVDNCPPDLHRRLAHLARAVGSRMKVLTVEYDIRDDQPEGTNVVRLDSSSLIVISSLVRRRFAHLSQVDADTIAEISGGNARIALALAGTIDISESVAGLSDEELFQRLFRQRHAPNASLLLAAQACSLLYSFQGEAFSGSDAELPNIAALIGQAPAELYRHVAELKRRDLLQSRSVWRAILPHAIANRLASMALNDIPTELIEAQFLTAGSDRLAKSFSRRLSYLHDNPAAVSIVKRWLAPGGLLGEPESLNALGNAMFKNIAPVTPEAILGAMERMRKKNADGATNFAFKHLKTLVAIAYESDLFDRSMTLMVWVLFSRSVEREIKDANTAIAPLFHAFRSGTKTPQLQRLAVVERLIKSGAPAETQLGFKLLDEVLEARHFRASELEFGARSRSEGFAPKTEEEIAAWYLNALGLVKTLAGQPKFLTDCRNMLATNMTGLWRVRGAEATIVTLCDQVTVDSFWPEGWLACREALRMFRKHMEPDRLALLESLAERLAPKDLVQNIETFVFGDNFRAHDVDTSLENISEALTAREQEARTYGRAVAADTELLSTLIPKIACGGKRIWSFGEGLAQAANDISRLWRRLMLQLAQTDTNQRDYRVLGAVLSEVAKTNEPLAGSLIDSAFDCPSARPMIPWMQTCIPIDAAGVGRLKKCIEDQDIAAHHFRFLAMGRTTDNLAPSDLRDLLFGISAKPQGVVAAIDILQMRLFSGTQENEPVPPELLDAGRKILPQLTYSRDRQPDEHGIVDIIGKCLSGDDGRLSATEMFQNLLTAMRSGDAYSHNYENILNALLRHQTVACFNLIFPEAETNDISGADILACNLTNPTIGIPTASLLEWCQQHPDRNYVLAAGTIVFGNQAGEIPPTDWSDCAKSLISHSPDKISVIEAMAEQFRPSSWSGSRASIVEANAKLLQALPVELGPDEQSRLNALIARFATEVEEERDWEATRSRSTDERFE